MQAIVHVSIYKMHHKRWKVYGRCTYRFDAVNIFPSHIASPSPNVLIMFYSDYKDSAYSAFSAPPRWLPAGGRASAESLARPPQCQLFVFSISKSTGTMNISKWVSDRPRPNIKHVFCLSKATLKNRTGNKASWKFMKTDNSRCILFPFVWEPVLLKEFKGRQNCDSSSKQTTLSLCVNKLTSPKILMSKLIPPNLLFTFLRLRLGYRSAMVAINSTSTGSFLGSTLSKQSSWDLTSLKMLLGLQLMVLNEGKQRAATMTAESSEEAINMSFCLWKVLR